MAYYFLNYRSSHNFFMHFLSCKYLNTDWFSDKIVSDIILLSDNVCSSSKYINTQTDNFNDISYHFAVVLFFYILNPLPITPIVGTSSRTLCRIKKSDLLYMLLFNKYKRRLVMRKTYETNAPYRIQ